MSEAQQRLFNGRTIVVSGASSGIGRAVAIQLAALGAGLILVGRNRSRLEDTACKANATLCHIVELDLMQSMDIMPAIQQASATVGRLYGFCHAAGIAETLPLSATDSLRVQSMLQVNYLAGVELARAITRRDILCQDGGAVLFVSAIYGLVGKPGQIAYSGSKGAINAAARAMAIELARRNVRVNVVSPGIVRTEMTEHAFIGLSTHQIQALRDSHPLGFGSPEDVARAVSFLLSPESKWITGTNLIVDGGCSAQ